MRRLLVSHNLLVAGSEKGEKLFLSCLIWSRLERFLIFEVQVLSAMQFAATPVNQLEKEESYGCELGATPFGLELEAQLFSVSQFSFSRFTSVASFLVP